MSDVTIVTPRGKTLSATFINPVDAQDAIVIFAHDFLSDRHNEGWFDSLARAYRAVGYATLQFDFAGCGTSDDEPILLSSMIQDIQSVSSWAREQGFARQMIHAHGFGSLASMFASPVAVETMVLISPTFDSPDIRWDSIFTEEQLDELEKTQYMRIENDTNAQRDTFVITGQTLVDFSMIDSLTLLDAVSCPLLNIFDASDEKNGLVAMMNMHSDKLPSGSQSHILRTREFGMPLSDAERPKQLIHLCQEWAREHLPLQ